MDMSEMTGPDAGFDGGESYEPSFADVAAAAEQEEGAVQSAEAEAEEAEVAAREPLPREEVERRWRQTQGALRSSRADLKAMRSELAELRAQAQASYAPAAPPDPREDPLAAVEWMQGQFVAAQQQQATAQFVSSVESQEAEVAASNPDYYPALEFLRTSRRQELLDYGANEHEVDRIVANEFVAGVAEARRQGLNPARVAFKLAQERGFARRGRLHSIEAGAAASRTLSAAGGRGGHEGGSLEARIANLSGSALRDAWRRHKAAMS